MPAPQSDAFKKAIVDSKKLVSKPSNDELLELYGESEFEQGAKTSIAQVSPHTDVFLSLLESRHVID